MQEMAYPLASEVCYLASRIMAHRSPGSSRENGAVAVIFAVSLVTIIGFFGLALDLTRVYNRKVEMQGVADTISLAAARKLNGNLSGISSAVAAAQAIMQDQIGPRYNYTQTMEWADAAIKFGRSVNGSMVWMDVGEAKASPAGVRFVKIDTNALDPAYGRVDMLFMPFVASSLTSVSVSHAAVAGRNRLNVTPLAICAMSSQRQEPRPNQAGNVELVELGFRRGVSYDLMNLNPNGSAKAHFLIDPVAKPGAGSASSNFALSTIGPYVCTGTVALPKVSGASVSVQSGFPLASLFNHLNSRFDIYNGGACDPNAAPPDTNIKQYTAATIGWMNPRPTSQRAKPFTTATSPPRLQTIADLPSPNNQPPGDYGPLWAYARAVPWPIPQSEPDAGYTPFAATAAVWTSLYATGPGLNSYPAGATATPYFNGGSFAQKPSSAHYPGIKNRRVLNIPLLECPVSGSVATVVGIGKFFMTIPADANIISAEFAGLVSDDQLGGRVEITQ